jgi:CHAT domain-containing protein
LDLGVGSLDDEYCGLDMAFRLAGAGAVVSTLWRVSDPMAALVGLLLEQYQSRDRTPAGVALQDVLRHVRSGEWQGHIATREQILASNAPPRAKDRMLFTRDAFSKLDPRILQKFEHWALYRCFR